MPKSYRIQWMGSTEIPHIDLFLKDIEAIWLSRGGGEGLSEALSSKLISAKDKIQAMVVWEQEEPVGMAWVEKVTAHYGNMVVHALKPEVATVIAKQLVKSGILKSVFSELIQFDESEAYRAQFLKMGLLENQRQRMGLELSRYTFTPTFSSSLILESSFTPMQRDSIPISSEISFLAHQVSKDYVGYPDLETLEKRIGLETMVYDRIYGPILDGSSLFMTHQGYPVASCLVIEIPCWGYERVPWIFDLCVHPLYHGKGFGRRLMQESLNVLQAQDFPIVGLAVTLSNHYAIALYESLGFEVVEYFSEFAQL